MTSEELKRGRQLEQTINDIKQQQQVVARAIEDTGCAGRTGLYINHGINLDADYVGLEFRPMVLAMADAALQRRRDALEKELEAL